MNVAGLVWLLVLSPLMAEDTALRGFAASQWRIEHEWEERAHRITSAERAGEFMKKIR